MAGERIGPLYNVSVEITQYEDERGEQTGGKNKQWFRDLWGAAAGLTPPSKKVKYKKT